MRNFNEWLGKMRPSINNYNYYVDFEKVYANAFFNTYVPEKAFSVCIKYAVLLSNPTKKVSRGLPRGFLLPKTAGLCLVYFTLCIRVILVNAFQSNALSSRSHQCPAFFSPDSWRGGSAATGQYQLTAHHIPNRRR